MSFYEHKTVNLIHKPGSSMITKKSQPNNLQRKCRLKSIESHILNKSLTLVKKYFLGFKILPESMETYKMLQDVWTVKEVTSCIKSKSGASEILKNLQQRKKDAHEFTLNSMLEELATIHNGCNDEFRKISEQQKRAIITTYEEIEIVQMKLREIHVTDVTEEAFANASQQVECSVYQHKLVLDHFFDAVQSIEQKRLICAKPLMRKYSKILLDIFYSFPEEIQYRIEKEILNYNRMVLQNHRTYADLFLQIRLLFDTSRFKMKHWIDALKSERNEIIRTDTLQVLEFEKQILMDADIILLDQKELAEIIPQLRITIEKLNEIIKQLDEALFSENIFFEHFKKIDKIVARFDKSFKRVIKKCNVALLNICNCFENQVESFKLANVDSDYYEQDNLVVDEMLPNIRKKHKEILTELENLRYDTVLNIQEALLNIRKFFEDFISLRTKHVSRATDIENELTTAVENVNMKYGKVHKEFEVKLNVALENARQEYIETNLEKRLTQVYEILRQIEEKWINDFQDKHFQIKKYKKMAEEEIPILLLDIEKFVLEHFDEHDVEDASNNYLKNENATKDIENYNKLIDQINLHLLHFNVSIADGIAALIQNITSNYPIHLKQTLKLSDQWEKDVLQEHKEKIESEMTSIANHRKNIRCEVYETRNREIQIHKDRLEEHTMGIYQFMNSVPEELKAFLQEKKEMNKNFQEEFIKNYTELAKAESRTLINRLIKMKMATMEHHVDRMKTDFTEYRNQLINKCIWMRDQTDLFVKSICLFKDGGNFHTDEAKEFRKALSVCVKSIERLEREAKSKIDRSFKELLADIDKKRNSAIERTNAMIQDRNFHATISSVIMKCTNLLENEVSHLIDRGTKLTTDLLGHMEIYKHNAMKNLSVKNMLNTWNEILYSFNESFSILSLPFPSMKETVLLDVLNNLKEYRSSIENEQILVGNSKKSKPLTKYIDYRKLLFDSEKSPISEGNFFSSIIISNLWNTFTRVQDMTKNYFSSLENRDNTKEDFLVSNYNDFMEKIWLRFRSYLHQCRNIWIQELKEFLELAKFLKKNILKWILNNFREFHEVNSASIIVQKERASVDLKETIDHFQEKRVKLANSLKVMHGFPGNKNLLEDRSNVIQTEERLMCEKVKTLFNEFKTEFDKTYDICRTSLMQLTDELRGVLNKLEFMEATVSLQNMLKDNIAIITSKKSLKTSGQSLTVDQAYLLNVPNKIKRPSIKEWPKQKSSLVSKKNTIGNFGKIFETRSIPTKKISVGRPIDLSLGIDSVAENYEQKIEEIYISALEEADTAVKRFHEDGQNFLKIWNRYATTVTKVYSANLFVYNNDLIKSIEMDSNRSGDHH
ncbi:uncharacterized protein LOC112494700 isoform X2 [Cephus cinctus]|uniref:Uncharacterized protein LOC112494700 isoform X2 n=1 Tax=Cephus cinctus TaxID=211228 RepID=A0AAJ7RMP2_CEPCN|nr:uncharacterized protein LOC112494700 isoform X2 [Cephus cinctus]